MMEQAVDRGAGARDSIAQACPAIRFCDREELKKPAGHRRWLESERARNQAGDNL